LGAAKLCRRGRLDTSRRYVALLLFTCGNADDIPAALGAPDAIPSEPFARVQNAQPSAPAVQGGSAQEHETKEWWATVARVLKSVARNPNVRATSREIGSATDRCADALRAQLDAAALDLAGCLTPGAALRGGKRACSAAACSFRGLTSGCRAAPIANGKRPLPRSEYDSPWTALLSRQAAIYSMDAKVGPSAGTVSAAAVCQTYACVLRE